MDWVKNCWVARRLTALQLEQGTLNHLPVVNPGVQEPWTYLEAKQKHCWGHARALHMVSTSYASYGLYPSHDAPQVPTLLGVVASVCTTLLIRTQQLPTLLGGDVSVLGRFTTLSHSETHKAEVLLEKRDVQEKAWLLRRGWTFATKSGLFFAKFLTEHT